MEIFLSILSFLVKMSYLKFVRSLGYVEMFEVLPRVLSISQAMFYHRSYYETASKYTKSKENNDGARRMITKFHFPSISKVA